MSLNPTIDLPSSDVSKHVRKFALESQGEVTFRQSVVQVTAKVPGAKLRWEFATSPVEDVYTCFWKDVVLGLAALPQLVKELQAKDEEIADYVDGGATLSRKSLQTAKFDLSESCKKAVTRCPTEDPVSLLASEECRLLMTGMGKARDDRRASEVQEAHQPSTRTKVTKPTTQPPKATIAIFGQRQHDS